jgi:hypothetical protein
VAMLPQGSSVLPANVPPAQAMMIAKIRQLLASDQSGSPGQQLLDQQKRANDPQLQQKVMASLLKAIAAHDVMHPPVTPTLTGQGWKSDPWADWRPLTGVAAAPATPGIENNPGMQAQVMAAAHGGVA